MKLSRKYATLFNPPADVRYIVVTGGRFSAKSFTVSAAVMNLVNNQNRKALYTRYTLTSAKDSIIPEFYEKVELLGLTNFYEKKIDRIVGAGSREVVFKGIKTSSGNQTAKLKSLKGFSIFVLDEAEEENDEVSFEKINLSIRESNNQNLIILILNPTTKEHWIYKRFFEGKGVEAGFNGIKDNVCYIHTTYQDALQHIPKDYLHEIELMQKNDPQKYEHIMLGGWLQRAEGVVFSNWRYGEFDNSLPFGYGLDFGFFPDPDVCVKCAIDNKARRLYVQEVLKMNNAGTDALAENLKNNIDISRPVIADSAEKRLIYDLAARGVRGIKPVVKFPGSVNAGIKLLEGYEIIVHPDSTEIGKELNNYVWNDKRAGIPVDAYNHRIDAFRYYAQTFAPKAKSGNNRVL